jgi:hypothetical protein
MAQVFRLPFLAAAVLFAGCSGGASSKGDAGTDVDTDTDTDADAGTGTDTDTDADGGADSGGADAGADAGEDGGPWNGCVEGIFTPFFGNLHAHTGNSDGEGTPADAFAMARDVAGLDVMAVTDHLEQLYTLLGLPSDEYPACLATAEEYTADGEFVALCGYEYGSGFGLAGSTGHNVVLFNELLFPMVQLDFHDFYQSVIDCPTCITEFAHPGDEAGMTWNAFEYDAGVDENMNLFDFKGNGDTWSLYFQALDAGWHVSPAHDQDNHSANWGTADDARSGFYMSALTVDALYAAMRERRTFMTHNKDAALRLVADATCWMGSILTGYSSLSVEAEATDADPGDGYATLELFGPGGSLVASTSCGGTETCAIDDTIDVASPTYVVARAMQIDGDVLVSAPIWVAP